MKQITIDDLIPFLKKGWVAMDKNGRWVFYTAKPRLAEDYFMWVRAKDSCGLYHLPKWVFNIAPYQGDWKDSLIRVKNRHKGLEPHTYYVPTTPMHILSFPEKLEKIDLPKAFGIAEPEVIRKDFENWKKRRIK